MKKVVKKASVKKPVKKMQTGGKASADSTKYFNEAANRRNARLRQIESDYAKDFPGTSVGTDDEYKSVLKGLRKNLEDRDRQANKGKPGYDKDGYPLKKKKMGGAVKKAKSGGSFPDLNKDGKVTKADILVGRGVIKAKKGKAVKKAQLGGLLGKIGGGKGLLSKAIGGIGGKDPNFFGGMFGLLGRRKQKTAQPAAQQSAAPAANQPAMKKGGKLKKQAAVAIAMKKAGKTPKTMKSGGKMKKCAYGCK